MKNNKKNKIIEIAIITIRIIILIASAWTVLSLNCPLYLMAGVTLIQKLYNLAGVVFIFMGWIHFVNDITDKIYQKIRKKMNKR